MPHLEEQFPPVNPLVLQRPDALDPPDREREDSTRRASRAEDELPLPGSLADGIDRVTISASARVLVPIPQAGETASGNLLIGNEGNNRGLPELTLEPSADPGLDVDGSTLSAGLLAPTSGVIENRITQATGIRPDQIAERIGQREAVSGIENQVAPESRALPLQSPEARNALRGLPPLVGDPSLLIESPLGPAVPPFRGPLSVATNVGLILEPAEETPAETRVVRRADRSDEARPAEERQAPPAQVARSEIPARTETPATRAQAAITALPPETPDRTDNAAASRTDAADTPETTRPDERATPLEPETDTADPALVVPQAPPAVNAEREQTPITPAETIIRPAAPDPGEFNARGQPVVERDPAANEGATSQLSNTSEVLEAREAFDALQPPAFPELDQDEPFIPDQEQGLREEDIPAVAQQPVAPPPPPVEDEAPPTPPPVPNVEALDENPQALRRDNLGTDPALRSNREIRSFLDQFNQRTEPPEAVTEPEGPPITEVQNNTPPPPSALDNLEALRETRLDNLREQEEPQGVTRPEEERNAPPEPLTPESLLTGRGQNIDRFI